MHKFWILENYLKSECFVPSSTKASEETDRLKPAFRSWQLVKAPPSSTHRSPCHCSPVQHLILVCQLTSGVWHHHPHLRYLPGLNSHQPDSNPALLFPTLQMVLLHPSVSALVPTHTPLNRTPASKIVLSLFNQLQGQHLRVSKVLSAGLSAGL